MDILVAAALALSGMALALAQAGPPAPSPNKSGAAFSVVEASIAAVEAAYLSGQTTAHAVTQAHLDRIAAYDQRGPIINSLITVNPRALEEADKVGQKPVEADMIENVLAKDINGLEPRLTRQG